MLFDLSNIEFYKCPFKYSTGIPCPGCGITRALLQLLRLNFREAWNYNPCIYVYVAYAVLWLFYLRKNEEKNRIAVNALIVVVFAVYIIRFLTGGLQEL